MPFESQLQLVGCTNPTFYNAHEHKKNETQHDKDSDYDSVIFKVMSKKVSDFAKNFFHLKIIHKT